MKWSVCFVSVTLTASQTLVIILGLNPLSIIVLKDSTLFSEPVGPSRTYWRENKCYFKAGAPVKQN